MLAKCIGILTILVSVFVYFTPAYAQYSYNDVGGSSYAYYDSPSYSDWGGSSYTYSDPISYNDVGGTYYEYYNDYEPIIIDDYDTYTQDYNTYSYNDYPVYNDYAYIPNSYDYTSYSYPSYPSSYSTYPYSYNSYTYNPPQYNNDTDTRCDSFTVSDTRVNDGDYVTLTWRTTDANRVSINQGVGNVRDDGNKRVRITEDTTFTLTARDNNDSDTCTVTVRVENDTHNDTNPRCDSFTASDTRVDDGDYVTLTWRTTDADDVSINHGIGDVANDGNKRVRITEDTTFTLTARDNNDSDTCTVTVRVDEEVDNDKEAPRCRLYISDTKITTGQPVELRWNNERTDRAILKDSHGKEIFDTRDDRKIDEDADKITLRPTRATDYTLTVYNKNVKRTCTVEVDMEKVSVTGVRYQGINLGQVPYTGFEAGPVLTFTFYGAIVLWGLIMGYVLVFKKTALATVATATVASHALPALTSVVSSVTSAPQAESVLPDNLPVEETMKVIPSVSPDALHALEAFAHEQYVLISSDALNHVYALEADDEARHARLVTIINTVKARFPKEGDWTIINKERLMEVLG